MIKIKKKERSKWCIDSWKTKEYSQYIKYPSVPEVNCVLNQLKKRSPLVVENEILILEEKISKAQKGEMLIFQAGDCAESFDWSSDYISQQSNFIFQLGKFLQSIQKKEVISIGRIAGQCSKPRSSETEIRENISLPVYWGDMINKPAFNYHSRSPDPNRMLKAYDFSHRSLKIIHSQSLLGFKDISVLDNAQKKILTINPLLSNKIKVFLNEIKYRKHVDNILYTSHESLHLPYESSITRRLNSGWYNLGAHFLWVGMRTSNLNSAHIEYIRGIKNPIGIKISVKDSPDKIIQLINLLNPDNKIGRLSLIYRLGCNNILKNLPDILHRITKIKKNVTWICDPMHGNISNTDLGYKTRHYNDILLEINRSNLIHHDMGIPLGGIHLELTHDDVTECLGSPQSLSESDLGKNYKTCVDPRLNYMQAVFLIYDFFR